MKLHELCQSVSQEEACMKCRTDGYRYNVAPCGLQMSEITDPEQHSTKWIQLKALRKLSVKNMVEQILNTLAQPGSSDSSNPTLPDNNNQD